MMQDQQPYTPETFFLFIAGNLMWLLSIPIISDIAPWASIVVMYFINKAKVDEAAKTTWQTIKQLLKIK